MSYEFDFINNLARGWIIQNERKSISNDLLSVINVRMLSSVHQKHNNIIILVYTETWNTYWQMHLIEHW